MRPSSIVSFSQNVQYRCRTSGISLMVLGHPDIMVYLSKASLSSAWVACQSSCNLSLLAGSWCEIWYTCNFGNLIVSFWSPNMDRQSASKFFGPGIYLTVKLYCKVLIKIHCSLGVAWLRLLDKITSSGFWSVSSMNGICIGSERIFQLPMLLQEIQFLLLHIPSVSQSRLC